MVTTDDHAAENAAPDSIRRLTAAFHNSDTERQYRNYLAETGYRHEVFLQAAAICVFLSYGLLDVLAAGPLGAEFLALRFFVVAPLVVFAVALTATPKFRRWIELSTTFGFVMFAAAVIYMIYQMPPKGAPPYIIGLLVVMIFTSCLMRIRFVIAAPTYFLIGAAYCFTLVAREGTPMNQIVSGLFFMISVAGIAIITNYIEERRSRETWSRAAQRQRDAARIEELLVESTAADRSKLNFLTILTHELRTPLHQIIGFSELIKNDQVTTEAERAAAIDNILYPAKDLLKKFSQMLRYADATAGKLAFFFDEISIVEVAETLKEHLAPAASAKSVAIDISRVQDFTLRIDQHHTIFALSNLLENAIQASRAGSTVEITGDSEGDSLYSLKIRDQGCGMSEKQIAAALSPFEQNDQVRSRNKEGLGLGLTIARRLLVDQGAKFTVQSAIGVGTVITIDFDCRRLVETAAPDTSVNARIA
ncbi:MAG: hypothetical protein A3E78_05910 [Alphaproteobacteria bacterium RIFCSPHIGHO2_12_FULL_63_12]|nr:MAG: hypothetical protein A3E78_05910 [Alphaproteobacteria bacterium RIFCSPHIGHO2_12_FULL_63_12]